MNRKQIIIIVLIAFFVGSIGSIVVGRFVIPYIAQTTGWGSLNKLVTSSPIIINRTNEVHLNDGVNMIDLAKQSSNFVVSVYTGEASRETFSGLGVIMTSDGLVFTTKGVLRGNTEVKVVLSDGRVYKGLARAADPKSELAVLSIEATGLAGANFGSSYDLTPGQRVITLGIMNRPQAREFNSGFVTNSVANNKYLDQWFNSEILTDSFASDLTAKLNYSGAPVINLEGRLVGILSGDKIIISENIQTALNSYLQSGKIIRPKLGLQYLSASAVTASLRNFSRAGAVVLSADRNSPAAEAGLVQNDLIFEVNGEAVENSSLEQILNRANPISDLRLKLLRNNKEMEITVKLQPTQ